MVDVEKGQTALHKAAAYKRRTICCMLVAAGASLLIKVGWFNGELPGNANDSFYLRFNLLLTHEEISQKTFCFRIMPVSLPGSWPSWPRTSSSPRTSKARKRSRLRNSSRGNLCSSTGATSRRPFKSEIFS